MRFLLLFLLVSFSAHAVLYTPGSGGGGGAVDSVNGQTGSVVIPALLNGGNSEGVAVSAGTADGYSFNLKTNGTERMFINSSGVVTIGGDTASFTATPGTFGTFKFQTADQNTHFNVFEAFHSYYGNSSYDKYGALYRMSLRPGETFFTYSGEYIVLRADGFVSQPGRINTFTALKTALSSTNSDVTLDDATGSQTSIVNSSGVIKNAKGYDVLSVVSGGVEGSAHTATGLQVGTVTASDSTVSNTAIGIKIMDNITATGTSPKAYAIKSDSTADSKFVGTVQVGNLKIDQTPSASAGTPSTHKLPIVLNGVTYYILLTN